MNPHHPLTGHRWQTISPSRHGRPISAESHVQDRWYTPLLLQQRIEIGPHGCGHGSPGSQRDLEDRQRSLERCLGAAEILPVA
jgi:hypothetical protein